MSETSAEILDRIEALWKQAEVAYRDSMLEVGRLVHEYILTYLREHHGLSQSECWERGIGREGALSACTSRLDIPRDRVSHLVGTAMAVALLSGGCGPGKLCLSACTRFQVFIRRNRGVDVFRLKSNGGSVADTETWEIRKEFDGPAQDFFREAAREGYSQEKVSELTVRLTGDRSRSKHHRKRVRMNRERQEALATLKTMATAGTPKDIAEVLFESIRDAEDPLAIAEALLELVKALPKKRKRLSFAEAS